MSHLAYVVGIELSKDIRRYSVLMAFWGLESLIKYKASNQSKPANKEASKFESVTPGSFTFDF